MMVLAERRRLADLERDYVDEREARRGVDVGGTRVRSMTGGSSPGRRGVRFMNDGRI